MEINLVRVRVGMIVRAVLLAIPLCAHAAEPDVKQPRVALRSGKLQGLLPQGAPGAVFEGTFTATGPIVKEKLQAESCRLYREWRLREHID